MIIAIAIVCALAPWLLSLTATIRRAGTTGIYTLGAGMAGLIIVKTAVLLDITHDASWLLPPFALVLSGLLLFSFAMRRATTSRRNRQ